MKYVPSKRPWMVTKRKRLNVFEFLIISYDYRIVAVGLRKKNADLIVKAVNDAWEKGRRKK